MDEMEESAMSTRGSLRDKLDFLSYLRDNNIRAPQKVVFVSNHINMNRLPSEQLWLVKEQLFMALLDIHDIEGAREMLNEFNTKFPKSKKAKGLTGLLLEAEGNVTEAIEVYSSIIDEDPTNAFCHKRVVAILKQEGKIARAVEKLVRYVSELYSADVEAWEELADLYILLRDFAKAKFCFEELMILNPENYIYSLKLAEVYYTMGGYENFILGRKYFCRSIELKSSGNLRSYFGLCLTCSAIEKNRRVDTNETEVCSRLKNLCKENILRDYTQHSSSLKHADMVKAVLDNL